MKFNLYLEVIDSVSRRLLAQSSLYIQGAVIWDLIRARLCRGLNRHKTSKAASRSCGRQKCTLKPVYWAWIGWQDAQFMQQNYPELCRTLGIWPILEVSSLCA